MAIYSRLKKGDKPTQEDMLESLDGNLCRCTGYASIHAAANSFASDYDATMHTKQIEGYTFPPAWTPYTVSLALALLRTRSAGWPFSFVMRVYTENVNTT